MKEANDYRNEIIKIINGIDDAVFLRRLYKLIYVIAQIDNEWILHQFDRFIGNIQK